MNAQLAFIKQADPAHYIMIQSNKDRVLEEILCERAPTPLIAKLFDQYSFFEELDRYQAAIRAHAKETGKHTLYIAGRAYSLDCEKLTVELMSTKKHASHTKAELVHILLQQARTLDITDTESAKKLFKKQSCYWSTDHCTIS
jgi:hypothetical protein